MGSVMSAAFSDKLIEGIGVVIEERDRGRFVW